MRVVAFSDTHNKHENIILPEGDILIFAGDCTIGGSVKELESFIKWMSSQPHKFKYVVGGNHDDALQDDPSIVKRYGMEYLCDNEINVNGLRIYGSPWRIVKRHRILGPKARWSAFMLTEPWDEFIFREIPYGLDILITHMPPKDIMDVGSHWRRVNKVEDGVIRKNGSLWKFMGKESFGNEALLDNIKRAKPKYNVFGHIHDCAGEMVTQDTTFFNVAMCDADYVLRTSVRTFDV